MTERRFRKRLASARSSEDLKILFSQMMKSLPSDAERLYFAYRFSEMMSNRGLRIPIPENAGKRPLETKA